MWKRLKDLHTQALGRLRRDDAVAAAVRRRLGRLAAQETRAAQASQQRDAATSTGHRESLSDEPAAILDPMPAQTEAPPRPAPELLDAVELARSAAREEAVERGYDATVVGEYAEAIPEDDAAVTHRFAAEVPGYRGWRWDVTLAGAGEDFPVTVSEVLLRPGPDALVAREWVPWERRVRAGDLGIGDIFPTDADDARLAPGYLQSDDPAVEEVTREVGLGRARVLSRIGRLDAATRWHTGEFGPRADMARSVRDTCGTCGFYQPVAGSLGAEFGVCCNEIAPADGHVVDVEYGCGGHSEIQVDPGASVPVAELVYDDSLLDFEPPAPAAAEPAPAEPEASEAPLSAAGPASGGLALPADDGQPE